MAPGPLLGAQPCRLPGQGLPAALTMMERTAGLEFEDVPCGRFSLDTASECSEYLAELEGVGGDLVAVQTHRGHLRCRQRGFVVRKRVSKMMFKLKPAE